MRFGTNVLVMWILLSPTIAVNAWSHGGGRGASAPKAPHYNAPKPPHISQHSQPHFNQPNISRPSQSFSQGYRQQGAQQYGYRSRAKSNRSANSKLAHANSGTSGTHVKPKLNTGQVGSTRSQGTKTANVKAETSSIGSTTATSTGTSPTATSTTSKIPGSATPAVSVSSGTAIGTGSPKFAMANPTTGAVSVGTANPNTIGTTSPTTSATAATAGSGRTMLPYLFNGTGTTNNGYGYHSRRYSGYGNGYGNRGRGNSNYFGQMRALSRLINDLNQLRKGAVVNTGHTNRIRNDLMGVACATGRPPTQAVHQLSAALVNALPTRTVPMMNTGQLARDLSVVMNGSGMNAMQIQHAIGNAQSVLHSSGVSQTGIQAVTNGLRMVASWGNGINGVAQIR